MRAKSTTVLLFAALLLATAAPAAAQCSQCREAAAAASAEGARALNLGILVLLVPTLSMFVGVLVFALRRRDALGAAPSADTSTAVKPLWDSSWSVNR